MRINVTRRNIDEGQRGSCRRDPICLAMLDAGLLCPWVSPSSITWLDRGFVKKSVETPENVLQFMKEYDADDHWSVFPFEFELEDVV